MGVYGIDDSISSYPCHVRSPPAFGPPLPAVMTAIRYTTPWSSYCTWSGLSIHRAVFPSGCEGIWSPSPFRSGTTWVFLLDGRNCQCGAVKGARLVLSFAGRPSESTTVRTKPHCINECDPCPTTLKPEKPPRLPRVGMTGPVIRATGSGFISRSDDVPDPVSADPPAAGWGHDYVMPSSKIATTSRLGTFPTCPRACCLL